MMVMVMAIMMVSVALGVGAARVRNCIVSYFCEKRNNGVKWAMSTGTQTRISQPHGSNKRPNIDSGDGLGVEL